MRLGFLVVSAVVGTWGTLHHPAFHEWRYSRMSLPELEAQRGRGADDPRLLFHLGRQLNVRGRFAEADPLLRQAVGMDPESARLRDEWAKALLGSGLTTAAFGQLRQFAGTHPASADARFILGKFYFTQDSMRRACEELEAAVRLSPARAEAWAYLAGARDALGDLERAREAASRAVARQPRNGGYRLMLASLLSRTHRLREAGHEYAAAVRMDGTSAVARIEYADWLLRIAGNAPGDPRAEHEARTAVRLDPQNGRAHLLLGRVLLLRDRKRDALPSLLRAAELEPHDPAPALELRQAHRALEDPSQAAAWNDRYLRRQKRSDRKQALLDALRKNPKDPVPHRKLARLFAEQDDAGSCIRHHAAALRMALDAPRTLIAAAEDLTQAGYAATALPLARRAVDVAGANPAAHEALGNALLALGHYHLAGQEFNKTASWWPERTPVLRKRLTEYRARRLANPPPSERAYQEARKLERSMIGPRRFTPEVEGKARQAVELEPTNREYLYYLLRVQMALRRNREALETVGRLLSLSPDDARARSLRAVLRLEEAHSPEALAAVEADLKAAAGDPAAAATYRYGLGLLALRRADGRQAAAHLREAIRLDPEVDVTYYKLFQAERLAGNTAAAERALRQYEKRQERKRLQAEALGDIAQNPDNRDLYDRAARVFDSHGMSSQAEAIRKEAHRRFQKRESPPTSPVPAPPEPGRS